MEQERRSSPVNRARRRQSGESSRFSRVTLVFSVMHVILSLLIIPMATASKFGVEVMRMVDDERLEECNLDLGRADADSNGELKSDELIPLVSSLSKGRISVEEFRDLPLRLRMIYHWTACSCVFEPDADKDCCIGASAHINIDETESSLPFMVNRLFCSELTRGIDKLGDCFPAITPLPSGAPSVSPSSSPTTSSPSTSPSTSFPSSSPSTISPSSSPSTTPTLAASESPTEEPPPSTSPTGAPTETITVPPTVPPTPPPTDVPPETLCITFQYELVNNRSLDADDVLNEVDNTLKTGLVEATETLVIRILNETYPRTARAARPAQIALNAGEARQHATHNPNDWKWKTQTATSHNPHDWSWSDIGGRRRLPVLREVTVRADALALGVDIDAYSIMIREELSEMYNSTRRSRHLHISDSYMRGSRRLVYYSDEIPVEIPIIVDNPNCPANNENGVNTIRCAIVSSNLCVVLETGDDPRMIRRTLVNGLSDAIDSGEFEDLIAQERLEGSV